jgi:hypothetical protein
MNSSQRGYDAEIMASQILEYEGYEIIHATQLDRRKRKIQGLEQTDFSQSSPDYICKKNGIEYVFEIKSQSSEQSIKRNDFVFTGNEVDTFEKRHDSSAKTNIMIIYEINNQIFYKIFNWSDFKTPSSYTFGKKKIHISLKNKPEIKNFKVWSGKILPQVPFSKLKSSEDIIKIE